MDLIDSNFTLQVTNLASWIGKLAIFPPSDLHTGKRNEVTQLGEHLLSNLNQIISTPLNRVLSNFASLDADNLFVFIDTLLQHYDHQIHQPSEKSTEIFNLFAALAESSLGRELPREDAMYILAYFIKKLRLIRSYIRNVSGVYVAYAELGCDSIRNLRYDFIPEGDNELIYTAIVKALRAEPAFSDDSHPISDSNSLHVLAEYLESLKESQTRYVSLKALLNKHAERYRAFLQTRRTEHFEEKLQILEEMWFIKYPANNTIPFMATTTDHGIPPAQMGQIIKSLSEKFNPGLEAKQVEFKNCLESTLLRIKPALAIAAQIKEFDIDQFVEWIYSFVTGRGLMLESSIDNLPNLLVSVYGVPEEKLTRFVAAISGFKLLLSDSVRADDRELQKLSLLVADLGQIPEGDDDMRSFKAYSQVLYVLTAVKIGVEKRMFLTYDEPRHSLSRFAMLQYGVQFLSLSRYKSNRRGDEWVSEVYQITCDCIEGLYATDVVGIIPGDVEGMLVACRDFMRLFTKNPEISAKAKASVNNFLKIYFDYISGQVDKGELTIEELKVFYKKVRDTWGKEFSFLFSIKMPIQSEAPIAKKLVTTEETPQVVDLSNFEYNGSTFEGTAEVALAASKEWNLDERNCRKLKDALSTRTTKVYFDAVSTWEQFHRMYAYEKSSRFNRGGVVRAKEIAGYREIPYDTGYEFYQIKGDVYLVTEYDFADQKIRFSVQEVQLDKPKTEEVKNVQSYAESVSSYELFVEEVQLLTGARIDNSEGLEGQLDLAVGELVAFIVDAVLPREGGGYRAELLNFQNIACLIKNDSKVFRAIQFGIKSVLESRLSEGGNLLGSGIVITGDVEKRLSVEAFWKKYGNVVSRKIIEYILGAKTADAVNVEAFTPSAIKSLQQHFDCTAIAGWKSWLERQTYRCQIATLSNGDIAVLLTYLDTETH